MWVDQECYFGPDRRRKLGGLRVRERRRHDYACTPPSVPIALRQLRMRVLDARGAGAQRFADRAQGVALLAQIQQEYEASDALASLAMQAARGVERDVRPALYDALDRVHAQLSTLH